MDKLFAWVEEFARAARASESGWRRWLGRARAILAIASVTYLALLVFGLAGVQVVGERNWLFSLFLLLPPLICLLPLALLSPLCLVLRPRLCLLHLVACGYVLLIFMPFHWARPLESSGEVITVLTNNMGERRTRYLFPLVEEARPDILVLQDASASRGRALAEAQGDPGMHVVQQAHFVLVSRYPILRSGLVEGLSFRGTPSAAWFELDLHGEVIVVYNVHLPTPRHDLERLRGRGFLAEIPRLGGIYSGAVRAAYRESLQERTAIAAKLADLLAEEKRPLLALGDFNAAGQGHVRRLFSGQLTDVFAERGRGYGLTFPGVTRNPFSFFGPWLRLDYIFVDQGFKTLECRVERRQPAQHRAVLARLERVSASAERS